MHRMQIQLTVEQERALKELARLRGSSISALVRESVDRLLEPTDRSRGAAVERAERVMGAFDSGLTDVSERHDTYLAEAFGGLGRDD